MTDKQSQNVKNDATAIQAGRDVSVGYTADDVAKVIEAVGKILPALTADAEARAEARFSEFKERLIDEIFAKGNGNPEAFREPDFIHALKSGQDAYGRTDSEAQHKSLVDLVARRSTVDEGSRRAFILNEAIEKTGKLSLEELASIALVFTINNAKNESINRINMLTLMFPWLESLERLIREPSESVAYVDGLGLGSIISMPNKISDRLKSAYPIIWKKPRPFSDVMHFGARVQNDVRLFLAVEDDFHFAERSQHGITQLQDVLVCPQALNLDQFIKISARRGESEEAAKIIWSLFEDLEDDPIEFFRAKHQWFDSLCTKFDSGLNSLMLGPAGLAVAHAYLSGQFKFDSPLSLWVR